MDLQQRSPRPCVRATSGCPRCPPARSAGCAKVRSALAIPRLPPAASPVQAGVARLPSPDKLFGRRTTAVTQQPPGSGGISASPDRTGPRPHGPRRVVSAAAPRTHARCRIPSPRRTAGHVCRIRPPWRPTPMPYSPNPAKGIKPPLSPEKCFPSARRRSLTTHLRPQTTNCQQAGVAQADPAAAVVTNQNAGFPSRLCTSVASFRSR